MTTLHLVDAFAHIYRAHYANPSLTNGSAFFFTRMLQTLTRDDVTHIAVVFDVDRGSRYRYALHPNYKAGRNERPPELDVQLPMIKDIVRFSGWNAVEFPGAEADDVLATLACRAGREGFDKVRIHTPDKDLLQLVNDERGIEVQAIRDGIPQILDEAGVVARMGVRADQIVDFLTLLGDTSDNVPGVEGIGDKGAATLLASYENLEGILFNQQALRSTYRTGLEAARSRISQSRKLVTVVRDLDLRLPAPMMETFKYVRPSRADERAFFKQIGFPSLAPEMSLDEMSHDDTTFDDL